MTSLATDLLAILEAQWRDTGRLFRADIAWLLEEARQLRTGYKRVTVQVFPLWAGREGIWLLSGAWPWSSGAILDGVRNHQVVEDLLRQHGIPVDQRTVPLLHETSCMDLLKVETHTYLAEVRWREPIRRDWPDAIPIDPEEVERMGPPPTHGAAEEPDSRVWDPLIHGIGVFHTERDKNATTRRDMSPLMRRHVSRFEKTLYRLYEQEHPATVA
jgi:hypothetical protein